MATGFARLSCDFILYDLYDANIDFAMHGVKFNDAVTMVTLPV